MSTNPGKTHASPRSTSTSGGAGPSLTATIREPSSRIHPGVTRPGSASRPAATTVIPPPAHDGCGTIDHTRSYGRACRNWHRSWQRETFMARVFFDKATRIYPGTDVPAVDALDLEVEDGEFMV